MKHSNDLRAGGGRKPSRYALQQFDDGVDVLRRHASRSRGGGKHAQRDLAVCRQVQRALMLALAGCGDPILQSLSVDAVEPAPDASRLRVLFSCADPQIASPAKALSRLAMASGHLRQSVAQAIVRKRAPNLIFAPAAPQRVDRDEEVQP